jgi:hypothetical protein
MRRFLMEQNDTYEVKIGTTTFVVSRRYSGTQSLEEVLKIAIKRKLESEAFEKRYN